MSIEETENKFYETFNATDGWGNVSYKGLNPKRIRILIDRSYSEEELEYLKNFVFEVFFKKYSKIEESYQNLYFQFNDKSQFKEIVDIFKDINFLIRSDSNLNIEEYNQIKDCKNIKIADIHRTLDERDAIISPMVALRRKQIFGLIINEIKEKQLSPFEAYTYIYKIAKMFKEYKSEDDIWDDEELKDSYRKQGFGNYVDSYSRNSAIILNNDYMVCTGYAALVEDLVKELNDSNLKAEAIRVSVDKVTHAIVKTHIKDEKYDINGVYYSDPTQDRVRSRTFLNDDGNIDYSKSASVDLYMFLARTYDEIKDDYKVDNLDIEYNNDIITGEKIEKVIQKIYDVTYVDNGKDNIIEQRKKLVDEAIYYTDGIIGMYNTSKGKDPEEGKIRR